MILSVSEEIVMSLYRNLNIEQQMFIFKKMQELDNSNDKKKKPMKTRKLKIIK